MDSEGDVERAFFESVAVTEEIDASSYTELIVEEFVSQESDAEK